MTAEGFNIPVANLDKLRDRIGDLNKRASKLGVPPIQVEVGEPHREVVEGGGGERQVVAVEVTGVAPRLNGWQFVATLEHDEDGTIIRRIPTFEADVDLSQYRDATPENCDHCGYKRKRNDTYIVAHVGDGEGDDPSYRPGEGYPTKQVGSNCLKDFTGHESPQAIARYLERVREVLDDIRGGHYSEGGFVPRYPTREFMARVVMAARAGGWVSKREAWEGDKTATAEVAGLWLKSGHRAFPTESDYIWAHRIVNWAESLKVAEDDDDYLWNVHIALRNGSLTERQFGIAASATQAYKRVRADSYAGEVGDRVDLTFTVERKFENDDYVTYVLRDQSLGRSLKWSTAEPLDVGATYSGSFNIRALADGKYGKQTLINYPRDLERVG